MDMKKGKIILVMLLAALLLTGCLGNQNQQQGDNTMPTNDPTVENTVPEDTGNGIAPLRYPDEVVQRDESFSVSDFSARAAGETSYVGNGHYDGTSLIVSPFYTGTVNKMELPVYATPVYVADGNYGVLHSYASVNVDFTKNQTATITLTPVGKTPLKSAQLFSQGEGKLLVANGELTLKVKEHGVYTIVVNDSQSYAITVFVRTWENEDAAIAQYREQYGEENVIVYEPGLHEIDYIWLQKSNMVLYLKAGAVLLPKHTFDIQSDSAASNMAEFGAQESNGIGLNRYPVVNGYACENLIIAGRGTVDMTQLDWHERRGIVFTQCTGVTMDGVIMLNPCEWAFITYRCTDVNVTQSAVFGYRTNSDAFAICNSINVNVSDCFARTGDDMFEVKALGGVYGAVSKDITFSRCTAWGSKARCFGVIAEIEKDVTNILFEDGIVIFRDAIWDNNRLGSLVVLRECGSGNVDGVTFRNILIHYDYGRPINVGVYSDNLTGGSIKNVVFENITYRSAMKGQIRCLNGGQLQITFKNISANGNILDDSNMKNWFSWDRDDTFTFLN